MARKQTKDPSGSMLPEGSFVCFRAIARISLLVPPRHSLRVKQGKITPFRPFYLEKCQKNDRKLIEKIRTETSQLR